MCWGHCWQAITFRTGIAVTLFSVLHLQSAFVAYTLLAMYQPESGLLIGSAIVLEYFGYGFGFVGLTLFMMQQVAPESTRWHIMPLLRAS